MEPAESVPIAASTRAAATATAHPPLESPGMNLASGGLAQSSPESLCPPEHAERWRTVLPTTIPSATKWLNDAATVRSNGAPQHPRSVCRTIAFLLMRILHRHR